MARRLSASAVTAGYLVLLGMTVGCEGEPPSSPSPVLTVRSTFPNNVAVGSQSYVQVIGTGFKPGATVTMGGAAASSTFLSDTSINALAPMHPEGTVDVVVTNAGGESATLSAAFEYYDALALAVTQMSPNSGLSGDPASVLGRAFEARANYLVDAWVFG